MLKCLWHHVGKQEVEGWLYSFLQKESLHPLFPSSPQSGLLHFCTVLWDWRERKIRKKKRSGWTYEGHPYWSATLSSLYLTFSQTQCLWWYIKLLRMTCDFMISLCVGYFGLGCTFLYNHFKICDCQNLLQNFWKSHNLLREANRKFRLSLIKKQVLQLLS